MDIPSDLVVDIRDQKITLTLGDRTVTIDNSGRFGPFSKGPAKWSDLRFRYLEPAINVLIHDYSELLDSHGA